MIKKSVLIVALLIQSVSIARGPVFTPVVVSQPVPVIQPKTNQVAASQVNQVAKVELQNKNKVNDSDASLSKSSLAPSSIASSSQKIVPTTSALSKTDISDSKPSVEVKSFEAKKISSVDQTKPVESLKSVSTSEVKTDNVQSKEIIQKAAPIQKKGNTFAARLVDKVVGRGRKFPVPVANVKANNSNLRASNTE